MELLRNVASLLILNHLQALRQPLCPHLQSSLRRDVCHNADKPQSAGAIVWFEFAFDLQPPHWTYCGSDSAFDLKAAAGILGALQRGFKIACVTGMQILFQELLLANWACRFGAREDFVNSVILPNGNIEIWIPFENSEICRLGGDPEARLAALERRLSEFVAC